jgi:hypothetical protein
LFSLKKVVSGGQTGVDRAALDVALALGLPCGGWVPLGRRAEDGPLAPRYPLTETPTSDYPQRTEWNVRDSDGTLILKSGRVDRGTGLTIRRAQQLGKPFVIVDLNKTDNVESVRNWIAENQIEVLNVAGPRESSKPGIYEAAREFLQDLLGS